MEVMQAEKQKLHRIIDAMPSEKIWQIVDFVETLEDEGDDEAINGPERLIVKNRDELDIKLQAGLDDIANDRIHPWNETLAKLSKI